MPVVKINGVAGKIEIKCSLNKSADYPTVVFVGPNPSHGGTMNNAVIVDIYNTVVKNGFSAVRFNFRGVGESEGVIPTNHQEALDDLAMVLDWLESILTSSHKYWIVGYAYGALIGMQLLMRRPELHGFVTVSPLVGIYDFSFLAPCPVSGLVVHGEKDQVIPLQFVDEFVERISVRKRITIDYSVIKDANHTFDDHRESLCNIVLRHIEEKYKILKNAG